MFITCILYNTLCKTTFILANISVRKMSSNFKVNCDSECGKQHYFDITLVTSSSQSPMTLTIFGSHSNHSSLHANLEYTTSSSTSSGVHSSLVITPELPGIYLVSCVNDVEYNQRYFIYSKSESVVIRKSELMISA